MNEGPKDQTWWADQERSLASQRQRPKRAKSQHSTMLKLESKMSTPRSQTSRDQSKSSLARRNSHSAFLNFSANRMFLFVFVHVLLVGQSEAFYDVCANFTNGDPLACMTSIYDVITGSNVAISVDPVTSTCGNPVSTWRRLGDRSDTVYTCNANDPALSHPPAYMIDQDTNLWWQSVNQVPGDTELAIDIYVSFNKLFRLAGDLIFTFYSGRPNKMVLERSSDGGVTWQVWQYYARSCQDYAAETAGAEISTATPTAVVCTNRYTETSSRTAPGRKVEFAVQEDRFDLFKTSPPNEYEGVFEIIDTQMLDFLLFTDFRVRLLEPATDGRGTYDMYHYGISQIQMVARCYCNLHASHCNYTDTEVVCDCVHNTQGKDCESCLPLYNERPWQRGSFIPYSEGTANECVKCECNDHSRSCTYDAGYGRGICDLCLHNTRGNHCELCILGFYGNDTAPLSAEDKCLPCDCEAIGVTDLSLPCDQSLTPGTVHGQCPCKEGITGRRCDQCLSGFYGLFLDPVGTCQPCGCDLDGTLGQDDTCSQDIGQCTCKSSTTGRICDQCLDTFYAFPRGSPDRGCFPCNCDLGGSLSPVCDKSTGRCQCRSGVTGDKCDRTETGQYIPAVDILELQPLNPQTRGSCSVTSDLWTVSAPFDGSGFAVCPVTEADSPVDFEALGGAMMQLALQWPYHPAIRFTSVSGEITGTLTVQVTGNSLADLTALSTRLGIVITPGCPIPVGPLAQIDLITFSAGTSESVLIPTTVALDARCTYSFSLALRKPSPLARRRRRSLTPLDSEIFIDSLVLLPTLSNTDDSVAFQFYQTSDDKNSTVETYTDCLDRVADLTERPQVLVDAVCSDIFFALGSELYDGAFACACNEVGSHSTSTCSALGGQCVCSAGVTGRACDSCLPGYYNFTQGGCTPCNCHPSGSENGACDLTTGQCPCLTNVAVKTTEVTGLDGQAQNPFDGTCSRCLPDYYGISTGLGCTACGCNVDGSQQTQCDELGQCLCKDSVVGDKCDTCRDQYYGFGPEGCIVCNCSQEGSLSLNCDLTTGLCVCKENVQGDKCADCKANFFNIQYDDPKGCQPCFCFNHGIDCASATGFQRALIESSSPPNEDFSMFLGDQHISFGQAVTLRLTADFTLDIVNQVVITLENNNKKLQHVATNSNDTLITRGLELEYSVSLWEENWYYVNDVVTEPATADNMYEILAGIDEVRPITSAYGQVVRATYFSLETATEGLGGVDAENVTFVEECTCLPTANVAGLSCDSCSQGNKRLDPVTATSYDTCVACDCSGRGATIPPECDELTGICLNCRNGTTGDQCELCAGNVTGINCDQCLQEFWGLDVDGCQPCECSSPGSVGNLCDEVTGQCTCVDHVVGRTCDVCEENFHTLTETGCVQCDSCYDEVAQAVVPLRAQRDNISAVVAITQAQDTTDVNGPFVERLDQAVADTEKLVNFLDSAVANEAQVLLDIEALNTSLVSIMDQLTIIEQNTTTEIEILLVDIETALDQANAERVSMEAYTISAYNNLQFVEPLTAQLDSLVADLSTVDQYLQAQADASISDQQLINDLNRLNHTTFTANELANQLSQTSGELLTIHQATTASLLELQTTAVAMNSRASQILADANGLAASTTEVQNQVDTLQGQLAELVAFTVDLAPYIARSDNAAAMTASIKSQLTAAVTLFESTNQIALDSVAIAEGIANQTMNITSGSSDWLRRSTAAEQRSLIIVSEEETVFSEADRALSTVNNFDALSEDAKQRADASLSQVAPIHETSKALIEESTALMASIASLQQTASSAKLSSQQALDLIKEKQQQLQGVLVQADQLDIELNNQVDLSGERYTILDNLKNNIVDPANDAIDNVQGELATYDTMLTNTDVKTTEALTATANAQERANQILIQLRDLDTLNTTSAQRYLDDVNAAKVTTNVDLLRDAAVELQTATSIQQAEIDRLTALKNDLKVRVENLQVLVDQLAL